MSTELVELSVMVFGILVANITWFLLKAPPAPPVRMAEVVSDQYRRALGQRR